MDHEAKQALLLGRENYRRGDYVGAEHFLRQVVEHEQGYADVFDMLGVIAYRRGDFEKAEGCFRRAVDLNGDYTEAQLNLVVTCNELGRYDEARDIYSALCARRSPVDQGREGRAEAEFDEAKEVVAGTLGGRELNAFERGRIANLHAQTAQAYQDAGRLDDAVTELDKALAWGPGFVDLRVKLGQLLSAAGHLERAEKHFRRALEENPRYVDGYLHFCGALLAGGRPGDALEVLGKLRRVDPDSPQARTYERFARRALVEAGD